MHSNKSLQKHISQSTSITVLIGTAVWIAFFVATSAKVITPLFRGNYDMSLGPLTLMHFTAEGAAGGGHTITMQFGSGLIWYFVLWIILGAAIGYLRFKRTDL